MNETTQPGLYVHVPFCSGKCPYCDFYSLAAPSLIQPWLEGITREAGLYAGLFAPFDTLYLGGGTPSLLPEPVLDELLANLRSGFEFSGQTEVTLEANPEDIDLSKASFLRALGVSRVSLGVQSLNDEELVFLGRRHSAGQSLSALGALRQAGFDNISLDLIYGLPGQSEASWVETMRRVVEFSPEHLSCYLLTVEPGTRFGQLQERGRFSPPEEEAARRLFLLTSEYLTSHGYIHYEISNFARGDDLVSRHNNKYWRHTPYLGLGPAAHSFNRGVRWWNLKSVRGYVEKLRVGRRPLDGEERLTEDELALEIVMLGLRTREGVSMAGWPERVGLIDRWLEQGLARIEEKRLILNPAGLVLADRLSLDLSGEIGRLALQG